ncbi:hypothetical protein MGYG_00510 [Nannizzia gypsea CBS 118893]|uniref:Uncharacterized protein n=1 Tax=Arthroderma gypseum (strain ATCC MYA-4604 / CBS 118893) TaxID=535722 RepID=E5R058_ARTGP|nr:hypothetical protein MGYG_00510 [Nannizzia gypsea CBS 118893]EFQ97469.1 hypothetical protein MGYG_00510 [Nannizzia gypsea CBS 118893]
MPGAPLNPQRAVFSTAHLLSSRPRINRAEQNKRKLRNEKHNMGKQEYNPVPCLMVQSSVIRERDRIVKQSCPIKLLENDIPPKRMSEKSSSLLDDEDDGSSARAQKIDDCLVASRGPMLVLIIHERMKDSENVSVSMSIS